MKKVKRAIEKCERNLNNHLEQDQERDNLKEEQKDLQKKFNYIKYFPNDKKYLSLFPKEESVKMVAARSKIMKEI